MAEPGTALALVVALMMTPVAAPTSTPAHVPTTPDAAPTAVTGPPPIAPELDPTDMSQRPGVMVFDPLAPDAFHPKPAVEGPAPPPAVTPPPPPAGLCHGSRPCKRLVVLAAVTGGLGLATIISGAVVASQPIRIDRADPTTAITYRPAGTAVLAIGVGVLVTGVLMALAATRASRQAQRLGRAPGWFGGARRAMLTR